RKATSTPPPVPNPPPALSSSTRKARRSASSRRRRIPATVSSAARTARRCTSRPGSRSIGSRWTPKDWPFTGRTRRKSREDRNGTRRQVHEGRGDRDPDSERGSNQPGETRGWAHDVAPHHHRRPPPHRPTCRPSGAKLDESAHHRQAKRRGREQGR